MMKTFPKKIWGIVKVSAPSLTRSTGIEDFSISLVLKNLKMATIWIYTHVLVIPIYGIN